MCKYVLNKSYEKAVMKKHCKIVNIFTKINGGQIWHALFYYGRGCPGLKE